MRDSRALAHLHGEPRLESLDLWFGSDNYGGNITIKDLAPILSGVAFPNLKHLGLMNCSWVDKIMPDLIKSKILPKLTSLQGRSGLGEAPGARRRGRWAEVGVDPGGVG